MLMRRIEKYQKQDVTLLLANWKGGDKMRKVSEQFCGSRG